MRSLAHTLQARAEEIGRDLRGAVRFLRRTPGFTLPAVLSLALGIAVNTTMFSVVNAVLYRDLGGGDSGDLIRIGRSVGGDESFRSASYDELRYLRAQASTLSDILGHQLESVVMAGRDGASPVSAEAVTTNYFATLRLHAALGRFFAREEERGTVTVISDRFWRRRFGADPSAIGSRVNINTHQFTIIGVAPRGFDGTFPGVDIDLWFPALASGLVMHRPDNADEPSLLLIARLKAHVSVGAARTEIEMLGRRMLGDHPSRDRQRGFSVASAQGVHPAFARIARVFLFLLMGIVGVVLLIACANVASMLLARATARRAELAVRLACGASRSRVVRQLLAESGVLAVLGAAVGILLSAWATRGLNAMSLVSGPTGSPVFFDIRLDTTVLAFTATMTTLTAFAFGLAPALQATRVDLIAALKGTASSARRSRASLRGALIIAQVSLSFVLLVAALLLLRSVRNSANFALGFEPDGIVVATFDLQPLGYPEARIAGIYDELLRRLRALPGVERAALSEKVPMSGSGSVAVRLPGTSAADQAINVPINRVSPDYFATIRQPLLRGRDFANDGATGHVAIINETMAHRLWGDADPIGRRFVIGDNEEWEVIGVAKNALFASFTGDIGSFVFLPLNIANRSRLTLNVRSIAPSASTLADVRRIVHDIDANVAMLDPGTMRERMAFRLLPARIARTVLGIAGLIALLLASGGLYGLVAYTLAQRVKEIGIRVALGSSRAGVLRVVVGGAFRLTAIGVAVGILLGAAATRVFGSLLYGVSPTDPLTFGCIGLLLLVVTAIAGYTAARKGLSVDPMLVLRGE